MHKKQVEFAYKGSRNYIQGPDLFNVMTAGYQPGELGSIRFTAHGFVRAPVGELFETLSKSEADQIKDARTRCQFTHREQMHYLVLVEGDRRDGERHEYDEDRVVHLMEINGDTLHLSQESPFSFIETVVSMNKHHLRSLFPDALGQWVFTRIDLSRNCDNRSSLSLVFRHNMNFRLTKSDVLVQGEKVGDIYFSLVKP